MPPKKKPKRRKRQQPTQRQSQKQVVNIKIGDTKPKRRRKQQVKRTLENRQLTATDLGNTFNMGIYSDLSRLNTLEKLINSLIPNKISTPINAVVPIEGRVLGGGDFNTIAGRLKTKLERAKSLTELDDRITQPSPTETASRTPVKSSPPPRNVRSSSASSLSSDDETTALPRRGTDYLSTGSDNTTKDLQTIDEMNLGASGFGDF